MWNLVKVVLQYLTLVHCPKQLQEMNLIKTIGQRYSIESISKIQDAKQIQCPDKTNKDG